MVVNDKMTIDFNILDLDGVHLENLVLVNYPFDCCNHILLKIYLQLIKTYSAIRILSFVLDDTLVLCTAGPIKIIG